MCLAQAIEAEYTTELSEVSRDARLYIVSLKDAAFVELLPEIVAGKEDALLVHTAGSIPMSIWEGKTSRYGVFYPMQTFSKQREVDFRTIPFFIESNSSEDTELLKAIASVLSERCMKLPLSSVEACIWQLCSLVILRITCMLWRLNY